MIGMTVEIDLSVRFLLQICAACCGRPSRLPSSHGDQQSRRLRLWKL